MQKYVSQPSSTLDGTYEVARWDEVKAEYTPIETGFPNEELSKERAHTLNEEYIQDLYEYEHQDEDTRDEDTRDRTQGTGHKGQVRVPNSIVSCQGKAASNRAQEYIMS